MRKAIYWDGTQFLPVDENSTITLTGDVTGTGYASFATALKNSGVTAGSYGSSSLIPTITVDAKGVVTGVTTNSVSIPTGLTAGSTSTGFVNYSGTTNTVGQMNGGTTAPAGTTRLNYNGYLYATRFYGDGSQLSGIVNSDVNVSVTNDTTTAATYYPTFATATSGAQGVKVSSTKLTFNPSTGALTATQVYNAVYNDYAEFFEKEDDAEIGDVIVRNPKGEGYIKSTKAYDKNVVGVFSDSYAQCIGGKEELTIEERQASYIALGLAGRVSVKVLGKIEIGDLLVSSPVPGVAMASQNYIPGTVIGKALESYEESKIGKIKMLIMNI